MSNDALIKRVRSFDVECDPIVGSWVTLPNDLVIEIIEALTAQQAQEPVAVPTGPTDSIIHSIKPELLAAPKVAE